MAAVSVACGLEAPRAARTRVVAARACVAQLPLLTARRRRGVARRGGSVRPRAAKKGEGDDKARGSQDWDALWRDFLKRSSFDPEQFVDRPQPPPGWDGRAREDIRRTENRALAPWNSPTFAKAGILVVLATLFVFVVIVGPPPSDGRCTLPWC